MEVNFEKLTVRSLSGRTQEINIRESLAELIYERIGGLKNKLLAEKIYKESPCNLNEEEIKLLKNVANHENGILSAKIVDAILWSISEE